MEYTVDFYRHELRNTTWFRKHFCLTKVYVVPVMSQTNFFTFDREDYGAG